MRLLFLLLMLLVTKSLLSNSPTTHTVIYNVTTSVTCSAGDTLKLYGTYNGDYIASAYAGTNLISNINPTMVSGSPFYVGYFVIAGNETSFIFSEISGGPSNGTITVVSTVGIPDYSNEKKTAFYPNPFQTSITFLSDKKSRIDILSSEGKLLESKYTYEEKMTVDLSKYPVGLYFIRLDNHRYKLIKEN